MWGYLQVLVGGFFRPVGIFLGFLAFTLMALGSAIFYMVENGFNNHVLSYMDALYFTVATMTSVGYGDIVPVSVAGRIVAMIMMITGTGIFVMFTAYIATVLLEVNDSKNVD
jgi:voltage-gated potassium channel